MKELYKYIKNIKRLLLILLLISFVGYFTIELWLNSYKEIFKGANKIGQFFSNLCISYISAFIFYFIVVHIKSEKDKENINEYVGIKVSEIITCGHLFFQPFSDKNFGNLKFEDLSEKLNTIIH